MEGSMNISEEQLVKILKIAAKIIIAISKK